MDEIFCKDCNCKGMIHIVQMGDTLYSLSRYYNVSIGSIIRVNRGINPYNLMVGDKVCIPVSNMHRTNNEYDVEFEDEMSKPMMDYKKMRLKELLEQDINLQDLIKMIKEM